MIQQTAASTLKMLQNGEATSLEVTEACLAQIRKHDPQIGAFLSVDEGALEAAADVDRRRKAGEPLGKLAGLPVAIKDIFCTDGAKTTCGSRMLENFVPPYDATVVTRLKEADAILIGKTNMDEFAMGSSTENSALQKTRNPWNLDYVPGGSSGGAAACVAAKMVGLSVGTDTGGSIRQPAGLCGVVGMKPTYGRISRYGIVAFASSLDQAGPLARTAEDAALLFDVIGGHDARDSTSSPRPMEPMFPVEAKPLSGLKLGVVKDHFGEGLDPEVEASVREAIRAYESLGASIVEIELPHNRYSIATYYIIAPSEASSNLARYDGAHYGYRTDEKEMMAELAADRKSGSAESPLVRMYRKTRSEGFGPEVKRRIMLGTYALSAGYYDAFYLKALKVRRLIRQDYDAAFEKVDFLIGPVTPTPAFKTGEKTDDPLSMYLGDLYTVSTNLAGLPGISVPCGFANSGLPIGFQLQGRPFDEQRLLQLAAAYQAETDWHTRSPEL